MLPGCAGSAGNDAPVIVAPKPSLPEPPAKFGAAVALPPVVAGQDARALAAKERAAILEANGRLANDRAFYREVVSKFGGGHAE